MDKKELLQSAEQNLAKIGNCMADMQENVKTLSECVQMNKFVPNALIGEIIEKLADLKSANELCIANYEAFKQESFAFEKIEDFKVALGEAKKQLESLDSVCKAEEFLKLKTANADIMALLNNHKKILKEILESEKDTDVLRNKVQPYGDFVDAVKDTDFKAAFDKLFPHMSVFGSELSGEAVKKPATIEIAEEEVLLEETEVQKEEKKEAPVKAVKEPEKTNKEAKPEEPIKKPAEEVVEESSDSEPKEEEREWQLFKAAQDNNCLIPTDYKYGDFSVDVSAKAASSFGVSELKNDIKKSGYGKMEQIILERLGQDDYIDESYITKRMDKPNENFVQLAAEHLVRRGYLKCYHIGDKKFYSPSARGHKAFNSVEARKYLNLPPLRGGIKHGSSEELPDEVRYAIVRLIYTRLFGQIFYDKEHNWIAAGRTFASESFAGIYTIEKGGKHLFYAGLFYKEDSEDDHIEESLNGDEYDESKYGHFLSIGLTKEKAFNNAVAMCEVYPGLKDVPVLYYGYEENAFYNGEKEEITLEEFWEIIRADGDETPEPPTGDDPKNEKKEEAKAPLKEETAFEKLAKELDDAVEDSGLKEKTVKEPVKEVLKAEPKSEKPEESPKSTQEQPVAETKASVHSFYLSREEIMKNVYDMLKQGKAYAALAYLKSCSEADSEYESSYNKLAYALNDPMHRFSYASEQVYNLFGDADSKFDDYLVASSAMRTFFYSHVQYDYNMRTLHDTYVKGLGIIDDNQNIGNVIFSLMKFKDDNHKGIDSFADYRTKSSKALKENLDEIRRTAKEFYDAYIDGVIRDDGLPLYVEACKVIFAPKNDLGQYLKIVCDDEKDSADLVEAYLTDGFIKDNCTIDTVNINPDAIDDLIDMTWYAVGGKRSQPLTSSRRQRLYNLIYKAFTLLCDWTDCVRRLASCADPSNGAYTKARNQLLDQIDDIIKFCTKKAKLPDEELAGRAVLLSTVNEIKDRLTGDYDEKQAKYFFIDFLKTDLITLDEEFMPVFEYGLTNTKGISSADRILKHCNTKETPLTERLKDIFENQGDDYGSAQLIMQYLKDSGNAEGDFDKYNLEESIKYARREFESLEDEFIGTLEYMQNDGLINSPVEDVKEKYIQISHEIFDMSTENHNYGYYKRIIKSIENRITDDAQGHSDELKKRIKLLRTEYKNNEKALNKIDKAEENIKNLHYNVAEDILSRLDKDEDEIVDFFQQTDYLEDFMKADRYGYYYEMVKGTDISLSNKLAKRHYNANKDTKAAGILISNWPANGGNPNENQIANIINALGFPLKGQGDKLIGSVTKQNNIAGKYVSFHVVCAEPEDNQLSRIKHPIAPFGSNASVEGFRVVWVTGNRDAERILNVIKEIGDAEDTIILMDQAIELSERRTLARKIKEGSSNKIRAIIDRVLLIYLIDNYNKDNINNMLMQIMMPFAYYQPYTPDSSHVMPPDMFMGRTDELQDIKSPEGANIVYGGRQLGKSRLLEMAKTEINNNSRGDRAVYVSIRDLDYQSAAKKVSRALASEGVLQSNFETNDWDKLAQAIKIRLNETKNRIPYLLLLIDEADAFIRSCDEVNYLPFDALKEIQSVGVGRFKFVIAGLRDIVRFNRKGALGNNSVIPHFRAIKVLPFESKEASELLKKPLYYMGFRFDNKDNFFENQIFAKANYFPGLIQLYCKKLIEAMRESDYAKYNEIDTPPYYVQKGHVRKVLADKEFTDEVWTKFNITLKDGDDDYYEIIALLMAWRYHEDPRIEGYTPFDIYNAADDLNIHKLTTMGVDTVRAFMDELCELNILKKTLKDSDNYWFLRTNFFQMMGSKERIEDKLLAFIEG